MFSFILIITLFALCCFAGVLDAAVTAGMKTCLETVQLHFGSIPAQDKWWLKAAQRARDEESSHSEAEEDEGAEGGRSLSPRDENEDGMENPSNGKLLDNEEDVTKESQVLEERSEAILKIGKEDSTEDGMKCTWPNLEEERRKMLEKEQQQHCLLNAPEEKNDDSALFDALEKTGSSIPEDLDAEEADCIAGTTHKLETEEIAVTEPGQKPDQQKRVTIKMTIEKKVHRHIGTRTKFLQQKYDVTVWVPREEDSSETVEISGDKEGILEVQCAIIEMLNSFSCWRKERLEMSACKYKRMCGHEGEILKRLRRDFDVRIYGPPKKILSRKLPNYICEVKVHGHRDKVARALEEIRRLTESEEETGQEIGRIPIL